MAYRYKKKKKRIRSVAKIEAEIAVHLERHRKHLLWVERNSRFAERKEFHSSAIDKEILRLQSSESSYKKRFGLFRTQNLTESAEQKLSELKRLRIEAEKKALEDIPLLDFPHERYTDMKIMNPDWINLQWELRKAKEKEEKQEKQKVILARVAKADGKTREFATSVKSRIPQNHVCPYCGNDLGDNPHADHIYPVSRGGLSTKANMVYVCASCNFRKRDKTLRMFIEEFGLDRANIEIRLSKLGKEF